MTKDEVKSQAEWISEFRFVKCAKCDIDFASPLLNKRAEDGDTFHCPLGHENYFPSGREKKEREIRESKRKLEEEEELYRMMHPVAQAENKVETPAEAPKKRWWP